MLSRTICILRKRRKRNKWRRGRQWRFRKRLALLQIDLVATSWRRMSPTTRVKLNRKRDRRSSTTSPRSWQPRSRKPWQLSATAVEPVLTTVPGSAMAIARSYQVHRTVVKVCRGIASRWACLKCLLFRMRMATPILNPQLTTRKRVHRVTKYKQISSLFSRVWSTWRPNKTKSTARCPRKCHGILSAWRHKALTQRTHPW